MDGLPVELVPERVGVVLNPNARAGWVGRNAAYLEALLRRSLGATISVVQTRAAGDAAVRTRELVERGCNWLVVVGGDGTLSEVVSAALEALGPRRVVVAPVPAGTGQDFARLLVWQGTLEETIAGLATGPQAYVDVGRCVFAGEDGRQLERHFLNVLSFGMGGLVDRIVESSPKALGGRLAFFQATLRALWRYEPVEVEITIDGEVAGRFRVANVFACNGRYAGGGMCFGPRARLADGLLDFSLIEHTGALRLVRLTRAIYAGTWQERPGTRAWRGRTLEARVVGEGTAWVDLDGEPLGTLPLRCEVVPSAVVLVGGRPDVLSGGAPFPRSYEAS